MYEEVLCEILRVRVLEIKVEPLERIGTVCQRNRTQLDRHDLLCNCSHWVQVEYKSSVVINFHLVASGKEL
jgi:hypothetical protein